MIHLGDEIDEEFLRELLTGGYLIPMPVQTRMERKVIPFPTLPYGVLSPRVEEKGEKATAKIIPFLRRL